METALIPADFIACLCTDTDAVWEIDLDTLETIIWHDTTTPELVNTSIDLNKLLLMYLDRFIHHADREKCLTEMSPESLRALASGDKKSKRFDIRLLSRETGFEWHESSCQVFERSNGSGQTVLFKSRCINAHKRCTIVETAVKTEYDYVVYIEADTNSYILYTANYESGTLLPPVVGMDYTEEMIRFNTAHCPPGDREKLIAEMRLDNLLEKLSTANEHVIYTQMYENDRLAYKKIRFSFYDRSHNILLATRTDITEIINERQQKKLLQDALNAANVANRAKSEFLSRMSHDIRTPMNAIIGMTAIAGAHLANQERMSDCLRKITTSSRLLLSLINEVLDMAKIESGRIILSEEEVNLGDLVTSLLSMIQPDLKKKGHRFDVHLFNIDEEWVICDSQRIQQVLLNFLSNAIKYTPDNGHIVFEITQLPSSENGFGKYRFIFRDNGIGMTPGFLEKVFEPFERADEVSIQSIQGTGLGMAIAKNIAEIMGGHIGVESEHGKGTTFTLTIPMHYGHRQNSVETLPCLPVLVVDDDEIVCENTCKRLDEIGMKSDWVTSGFDAIQKILAAQQLTDNYFAAIIDYQMPDMNGIETARAIRKIVGPDMTIILLSAYDWSEYEKEAHEAGIDDFIQKPLLKSRLAYTMKKFLNGNRQQVPTGAGSAIAAASHTGKRVLIVEDNQLNMEIATELLTMAGVVTDTAENGKVAVEKMAAAPIGYYDLIFMDMQMPVMDGCEASRQIRNLGRPDVKTLPIVAMTANAFAEDIEKTRFAGMNEHVAKPIDYERLESVLDRWLTKEKK